MAHARILPKDRAWIEGDHDESLISKINKEVSDYIVHHPGRFQEGRRDNKGDIKAYNPENCFFEHLASGEIIRGTKSVKYLPYTPYSDGKPDLVKCYGQDIALWRLSKRPSAPVKLIDRDRYVLDEKVNLKNLKVASNFADNFRPVPSGPLQPETPTIAGCQDLDRLPECNTGGGSSGSLVYSDDNGPRRVIGIITSEDKFRAPGSGYVKNELDTFMLRFDKDLVRLYESLPPGQQQAFQGK